MCQFSETVMLFSKTTGYNQAMSSLQRISSPTIFLLLFGILAVTLFSFWPVLDNDFVNFDDTKYLTQNPVVQEFTPDSVRSIFFSIKNKPYHYVPLTLFTFALEYKNFKLDPRPYHLNNLILHLCK